MEEYKCWSATVLSVKAIVGYWPITNILKKNNMYMAKLKKISK
jgi:hypothetical protein